MLSENNNVYIIVIYVAITVNCCKSIVLLYCEYEYEYEYLYFGNIYMTWQ